MSNARDNTDSNNNNNNIMNILSLLEAYNHYHDAGSTSLQSSIWNITKARMTTSKTGGVALCAENSGAMASLISLDTIIHPTCFVLPVCNNKKSIENKTTTTPPDLIHEEDGGGDKDTESRTTHWNDFSYYKLIDQTIKVSHDNEHHEDEEKENTVGQDATPLIFTDDNADTTQITTGLRRRKQQQQPIVPSAKKLQNTIIPSTTKEIVNEESSKKKNDGISIDTKSKEHNTHMNKDPLELIMMTTSTLYSGGFGSNRREMQSAQSKARDAIQQYIHAASLVAAIQKEINNHTNK